MTTTRNGGHLVYKAGADLSAKQYYIVKRHTTAGECVLSSAAADLHLGVLQNAPILGDTADILGRGAQDTGKVIAVGVLTPGCKFTSDSAGKAIATTTEDNEVVGIYIGNVNSAAGDIVEYAPSDQIIPPAS